MNKRYVAKQTTDTPKEPDTVLFESPRERLLVNLHLKHQRKFTRGGVTVVDEERFQAQFSNGEFRTSDPEIIRLMRAAPNYIGNIDVTGQALEGFRERFFERIEAPAA